MGVLVGVALLASTATLILTLLVVLLLWKPDVFHKRWRKQKQSSVCKVYKYMYKKQELQPFQFLFSGVGFCSCAVLREL